MAWEELLNQLRVLPVELGQRQIALELPDLLRLLAHALLRLRLHVAAGQPAADGLAAGVAEGSCRHGGSDLAEVVGDEGEKGHVGLLETLRRNSRAHVLLPAGIPGFRMLHQGAGGSLWRGLRISSMCASK